MLNNEIMHSVVHRYIAALNAGDVGAIVSLYAEDATRAVVWTGRPTPERSPT